MKQSKELKYKEIGHIVSYFSGVAKIQGLPHVFLNEVLLNERGEEIAIVIGFDERFVDALFFKEEADLEAPVFRSYHPFSIPVSDNSLGRILNGLGQPMDGLGELEGEGSLIFKRAPQIIEREPVSIPLTTGVKVIDTTLPIGRGQRELIIGDREIGKSTLAIDTVLNQKHAKPPVYCIYVISGQEGRKFRDLISLFRKYNTFLYTTIVAAPAGTSFAEQYLAPFVGCTIGEYFRDKGKDALIIYDDLSKHANTYRDISLILKRAPGREAYPGDIFSLHASLLERAAKLSSARGGGSLTALPIVETEEGDVTSFIPTNIISITDGQIYLERGLFQKGFLPAVNIGLSVSRVGSQAQPPILKEVVGGIRAVLAQYKELQKLSELEKIVSPEAALKIKRGNIILELLEQDEHTNVTWPEQVIIFYSAEQGYFDEINEKELGKADRLLLELIRNHYINVTQEIEKGIFDKNVKKEIKKIIDEFKRMFLSA